jgi:uncharacterized protein (DUF362 family)
VAKVALTSTASKNFADKDIQDSVRRSFDLLGYNFKKKIDKVLIKPNLCYYWDYSTGETTDPRVVSAIIDCLRAIFGEDISIFVAEADASAMKTKYSFKMLGYEELSRTKDVDLINLSEGDIVEKQVSVRNNRLTLPINKTLLESDLVINVPKLRTHNLVGITCSLKNMFGAIAKPRKFGYHKNLDEVIVGINKLVKSDVCIVDGIIARGKYPKKMGLILAGDDALATDFVVAKILGFNPRRIGYLRLAEKENVGDVNGIKLMEDETSLTEAKKVFPRSSYLLHKLSWGLQLKLLKTYSKISGDVIPPILKD